MWLDQRLQPNQPQPREPKVVNYQTAMRQLMDKPFCRTAKYREQQGRATRKGAYLDPVTGEAPIIKFEKALISDLRRRGIPMFAHNMVRTDREQDELFRRGKSQHRGGESAHNYGMAVDIIHSTKGWNLDKNSWLILKHIADEVSTRIRVPIEWGGDWDNDGICVLDDPDESFWDAAHFQLANWRSLIKPKTFDKELAILRGQEK